MEAAFLDKGGKDGARLASTLDPVTPRGTPFTLMIAYDFNGHFPSVLYRIVTVIAALDNAPTDLAPASKDDSFSNVHGPVIDNHRSGGRLGGDSAPAEPTRRDERERASQRLDMTTTSGSVYYHHDGLGNTIAITNGNAEVLERYSYDVFGRVTIVDASTGNTIPQSAHGVRHFYTGHDFQAELGLYLTHYRAYEPALGRWLSADPIGEKGGWNLYGYVANNPINGFDPYGLYDFYDFMDDASNFSAGVGDNLSFGLTGAIRESPLRPFSSPQRADLSFGLTGAIRESLPGIYGDNGGVDKCSGAYGAGEWTGTGLALVTGAAGGIKAAGAKAAGKEFSHWIPNRMGGPRSIWNGNYVSPARHYKHDPFRYPSGWRDLGPKWNPALQQLDRIPNAIKGGAAGAAYGGASQAANSRERP